MFVKEANPPHFCLNQDSFRGEKESGLYSFLILIISEF